jgi:hypothetical protein
MMAGPSVATFAQIYSHVFQGGKRIGAGFLVRVQSPTNPMRRPRSCWVTFVMATNFMGECMTVQNALPGFMKRYVLNSWRAPAITKLLNFGHVTSHPLLPEQFLHVHLSITDAPFLYGRCHS